MTHDSAETTASPSGKTATSRRHPRRRLVSLGAALAALALLGAACSDDSDNTETGAGSGSGGGGGDMTISITAPDDGATVEPGFDVELDPSVDIGEPDTGLHHVHLYYDGNISDDQSEYDIVYSADEPFTVDRDLGSGEHTIEAVIANADHSLTDVSDEITVTVGDDMGSGGGGNTTTTDGGGY
jgi:hypothetical protein